MLKRLLLAFQSIPIDYATHIGTVFDFALHAEAFFLRNMSAHKFLSENIWGGKWCWIDLRNVIGNQAKPSAGYLERNVPGKKFLCGLAQDEGRAHLLLPCGGFQGEIPKQKDELKQGGHLH